MFLAFDLLSFSKYINSNSDNREFSAPRKFQKEIINCCLAFFSDARLAQRTKEMNIIFTSFISYVELIQYTCLLAWLTGLINDWKKTSINMKWDSSFIVQVLSQRIYLAWISFAVINFRPQFPSFLQRSPRHWRKGNIKLRKIRKKKIKAKYYYYHYYDYYYYCLW